MTNELTNLKAFFTERREHCLSVSALEKEAEIPAKTLAHFLRGRRMLSGEHLEKLIPVLVDFGYQPLTDVFL
jgi:hypothetical protein